jgi:hypothetical protein
MMRWPNIASTLGNVTFEINHNPRAKAVPPHAANNDFTSASARRPTLAPMVREVGNQDGTGEVREATDTPGSHPPYEMPEG